MNESPNRRRLLIIGVIALIAVIIGSIIYSVLPKTQIELAVAPQDVELRIDNEAPRNVHNKQKITLSPGKHTLSFSREEFSQFVKEVTVKENETLEVLVALEPLTTSAEELLINKDSEEIVQKFKGDEFKKASEDITANYPILKDLPAEARSYFIASCPSVKYPDDKSKIAICAYVYRPGLEEYVLKHIRSLGYNPDDYEIIYVQKYEDE